MIRLHWRNDDETSIDPAEKTIETLDRVGRPRFRSTISSRDTHLPDSFFMFKCCLKLLYDRRLELSITPQSHASSFGTFCVTCAHIKFLFLLRRLAFLEVKLNLHEIPFHAFFPVPALLED